MLGWVSGYLGCCVKNMRDSFSDARDNFSDARDNFSDMGDSFYDVGDNLCNLRDSFYDIVHSAATLEGCKLNNAGRRTLVQRLAHEIQQTLSLKG